MHNKIFIQIASYRDPQLVPTVLDCIANATNPENLHFCIAWQHSPDELINEIKTIENIQILDIPYQDSKGACWARNQIQQHYNGEKYTLQLDSHHRFIKGWDTMLIEMFNQLKDKGFPKPILTSYASSFNPNNDPQERTTSPYKLNFDRFIPEGAVFMLPATIDNWKTLTEPIPTRFYSGHFCFAPGSFAIEVQHDPNYYFHGEEISIAVRAYTHGYDLFSPHKIIVWHEFTRVGRPKHWDDHNTAEQSWTIYNNASHKRNRCLFSMDGEKYESVDWGKYGFGSVRTLSDYEHYAGINFKDRSVQQETLNFTPPPNTPILDETEWKNSFLKIFKHCLDVPWADATLNDYDFWFLHFEKEDGTSIYRKDVDINELKTLKKTGTHANVWRTFFSDGLPKRWIVWPHSISQGWGTKIIRDLY